MGQGMSRVARQVPSTTISYFTPGRWRHTFFFVDRIATDHLADFWQVWNVPPHISGAFKQSWALKCGMLPSEAAKPKKNATQNVTVPDQQRGAKSQTVFIRIHFDTFGTRCFLIMPFSWGNGNGRGHGWNMETKHLQFFLLETIGFYFVGETWITQTKSNIANQCKSK